MSRSYRVALIGFLQVYFCYKEIGVHYGNEAIGAKCFWICQL